MRATQFIGAFTLAVAALSIPAMSIPIISVTSKCNEGNPQERPITCSDATAACLQVPNDVSFDTYTTAKQLASVGSATVWMTRAISSGSIGNATSLCLQIVSQCCRGTNMSKSEIPLPYIDEKGSIQIVQSS